MSETDLSDKYGGLDVAAWDKWYSEQDEDVRAIVDEYGLHPTKKFALANEPDRASYFRVGGIKVHGSDFSDDIHAHLIMIAYTSYDEITCAAVEVKPEQLVPYPYDSPDEIPEPLLDAEFALVENLAMLEEFAGSGVSMDQYPVLDSLFGEMRVDDDGKSH